MKSFKAILLVLTLFTFFITPLGNADETSSHPLTVDDTMGQLINNPDALQILQQELPLLVDNPQIEQAKELSLRALQVFAPAIISDDALASVNKRLAEAGVLSDATLNDTHQRAVIDPMAALMLETVPLWTGAAPGALSGGPLHTPSLTVITPDGALASGAAVIVAPGGGYQMLATGHEGRLVAEWFAAHGVTAFVLNYRLCTAGYKHPTQLQDAQRAVRWVRANASLYGISKNKIGMIGFSAGGHLTAMTETLDDQGNAAAEDPIEHESSQLNFAVLAYAALDWPSNCIAMPDEHGLLNPAVIPIRNVSSSTPPTFIYHTTTDELVSPAGATAFYDALYSAGVPVEMHIFAQGRHGLGLSMHNPKLALWSTLLANWLRGRDLIIDSDL